MARNREWIRIFLLDSKAHSWVQKAIAFLCNRSKQKILEPNNKDNWSGEVVVRIVKPYYLQAQQKLCLCLNTPLQDPDKWCNPTPLYNSGTSLSQYDWSSDSIDYPVYANLSAEVGRKSSRNMAKIHWGRPSAWSPVLQTFTENPVGFISQSAWYKEYWDKIHKSSCLSPFRLL